MTEENEEPSLSRALRVISGQSVTFDNAPSAAQLMALIRFLASVTSQVIFSEHAEERMYERSITPEDVYFVLRFGDIQGRITPGIDHGEWKCKVVGQPRGSRQVGVATVVMTGDKLFVKTVEWEDR